MQVTIVTIGDLCLHELYSWLRGFLLILMCGSSRTPVSFPVLPSWVARETAWDPRLTSLWQHLPGLPVVYPRLSLLFSYSLNMLSSALPLASVPISLLERITMKALLYVSAQIPVPEGSCLTISCKVGHVSVTLSFTTATRCQGAVLDSSQPWSQVFLFVLLLIYLMSTPVKPWRPQYLRVYKMGNKKKSHFNIP